ESPAEHERMPGHAEAVLQRLELPYRVVLLAAGDLGFASAKTYDLEVWSPGVGQWLEVSSSSTFTDFQARRANIRYRASSGAKPELAHTLNASGVALPRTIPALLETRQQPDGSVTAPVALVPYLGMARLVRGAAPLGRRCARGSPSSTSRSLRWCSPAWARSTTVPEPRRAGSRVSPRSKARCSCAWRCSPGGPTARRSPPRATGCGSPWLGSRPTSSAPPS